MKPLKSPSPTTATSGLSSQSPDAAWRLLAFQICSLREEKKRTKLSPDQVIAKVAMYHHLHPRLMTGRTRILHVARVRQIAMYVLRQWFPSMSLQLIGAYLGNRDHTTIMAGVRNVTTWMRNEKFRQQLEDLENRIDEAEEGDMALVDV